MLDRMGHHPDYSNHSCQEVWETTPENPVYAVDAFDKWCDKCDGVRPGRSTYFRIRMRYASVSQKHSLDRKQPICEVIVQVIIYWTGSGGCAVEFAVMRTASERENDILMLTADPRAKNDSPCLERAQFVRWYIHMKAGTRDGNGIPKDSCKELDRRPLSVI